MQTRILIALLAALVAVVGFSRIGDQRESLAVEEQTASATDETNSDVTTSDGVQTTEGDAPGPGSAGRPAIPPSRGKKESSTVKSSRSTEGLPQGTIPRAFEIAFTRGGDNLYLMNADGSDVRALGNGSEPGWSRDGKHIAVSYLDGGEIRLMNADGSGRQNLGVWGFSPTWSPDGGKLAFGWLCDGGLPDYTCTDAYMGTEPLEECGPECGIAVVARDGTGARHLGNGIWPDWGPDGRIMFADGTPTGPCYYQQGMGWTRNSGLPWCELPIWVMNSDGSGRMRLPIDKAIRPTWSPDGRKIAYSNATNGIFIANSDGTGIVQVAPGGSQFSDPSWSPDGLWLALTKGRSGYSSIYLRSIDGLAERRLTCCQDNTYNNSTGVSDGFPAFSPRS